MYSEPLISVIVPVYNAQDVLQETMGNIVYQTMFDNYGEDSMEILLIDDCSRDATPALLDDLCRQFPNRLRVIHLAENRGPGGARNVGMDEARGVYVGFVDCDDLVDTAFFERLYETLQMTWTDENGEEQVYFVDYADSPVYDEAEQKAILVTPQALAGMLTPESKCQLLTNIGYMYTRLIRREILETYKIRCREQTSSEDEDFLAQVVTRAESMNVYPQPLYLHKARQQSASRREANDMMKPFSMLISCNLSAFGRLTENPDYPAFQQGAEAFYCNRFGLALQLYEAYNEAGVMTKEFKKQLMETMRRAFETIVTLPLDDNPYIARSVVDPADIGRIKRHLLQ